MENNPSSAARHHPRSAARGNKKLKVQEWEISRFIEYPNNPRNHDEAIEKMVATIREFGFKVPVIATSDGNVVDGHLRLKAARLAGLSSVPVVIADDLSEVQVRAFRIAVNESTNWASWDYPKLQNELEKLGEMDFDLAPYGLDAIELPPLEDVGEAAAPPRQRSKTTIFVSVKNADATKARQAIIRALNKEKIEHGL